MGELVSVDFYGDKILARRTGPGPRDVEVSLRRMCENLGVGLPAQLDKLKRAPWATITTVVTVAEDGKQRSMTMLALRSVPMWLAGIDADRVAAHVREKLIRYQLEAADVLADHFASKMETAVTVEIDGNDPRVQLAVINALSLRATAAEAALAVARPKADAYDRFLDANGLCGLQNAGRALNVGPNLFVAALRSAGILTTQGRATVAYADYVNRGYFEHRPVTFHNRKTGQDEQTLQAFFTSKGIAWAERLIADGKLGGLRRAA